VWEVLGSNKSVVEGYGMRGKGEEEAPTIKNDFSWRTTRGGRNSPWRAQQKGEMQGMEGD
jgi:hypothetical protein